jgi:hypothetical protein
MSQLEHRRQKAEGRSQPGRGSQVALCDLALFRRSPVSCILPFYKGLCCNAVLNLAKREQKQPKLGE